MSANPSRPSPEDAHKATAAAAAETARALTELARRAGSAVQERFDGLGVDPREYTEMAGERLENAQQYLVDRINERPVPAALAALGIGVVIGMLLSGHRR
jgi:ElaB/YqjD/DUF883 family membrane-anchored ribosome-binding protein